ncbi:MAG: DEAD/DEAH box helicase [Planctomycetes bacterium]|nr:DEAD/DEAH box helicase [Planctomycetota bacterium]
MSRPAARSVDLALAPGARVVIRDEEWIVRQARRASVGGWRLDVTGTSELVRGRDASFLSDLDPPIVLRPEETVLVADRSPRYRDTRLYLDCLLRRQPPTDTAIHVGHRAALRSAPYQLQPAQKALRQLRPRILMADGVGLGKTIEVGVLLSELIQRGRGDRILVVALKSILPQFQLELWARFTIPLVRLDSVGIQRLQSKIPSNQNPFQVFDKVIVSIDTLKNDAKYSKYLADARWDVIVVDECQNVAPRADERSSQLSQRARLARLLSMTSDALILTSATPHDGTARSFAGLMNLLEPTAIADEDRYDADEVRPLFIRRFKKDVAHEVGEAFRDRALELVREPASSEEDAVFDLLRTASFRTIGRTRSGKQRGRGILFQTLLLKAFLSSPVACLETVEHRLAHQALQEDTDDARHDRAVLERLAAALRAVPTGSFRKYQRLLARLRALGPDDRVVVFSERIATLRFLREHLLRDLGLDADAVAIFHGQLDDQAQRELVQSFGTKDAPIRILLASDAASEGLNLHWFCHRLVHFDLPWSLITLEQRNGRIDRFGQAHRPELSYLLTIPGEPGLKGDLRVLERLIEKEDQAHRNIGDVAWLMGLHDAEREEERIAEGIEEHDAPEEVIPDDVAPTDLFAIFQGDGDAAEPPAETRSRLRLYADDLAYARDAFQAVLGEDEGKHVVEHAHKQGFTLHPPEDLGRRLELLPPELWRDSDRGFDLTVDRGLVMAALDEARERQGAWPQWQLFWELNPIARWLDDRVLAAFGRHEAPVVRLPRGLAGGERVVVVQGLLSNHRGQPVLVDTVGIPFRGGEAGAPEPLAELVARTGLAGELANPGRATVPDDLPTLLAPAVAAMREHLDAQRRARAAEIGGPLREGMRRLKAWRDGRLASVEQKLFADDKATPAKRLLLDRKAVAEQLYLEREAWINDGMRTVGMPYIRILAVLVPAGGNA